MGNAVNPSPHFSTFGHIVPWRKKRELSFWDQDTLSKLKNVYAHTTHWKQLFELRQGLELSQINMDEAQLFIEKKVHHSKILKYRSFPNARKRILISIHKR